jgi:8-oxo-dGTP pyrophosphatase MutT (NUDIX family)
VTHAELLAHISAAFNRPLPGAAAHALMVPRPRGEWPEDSATLQYRAAAGLLLAFPRNNETHLILTVRSQHVRHGGQVSMPGGVVEPGESNARAALREAHEEVAFVDTDVRLMGELTSVDIPVSGFRLHPVVASIDRSPILRPSDREVARILEVPLAALLDPGVVEWRPMTRGLVSLIAPAFVIDEAVIWGATAMVLAEFLSMLGWEGPGTTRS